MTAGRLSSLERTAAAENPNKLTRGGGAKNPAAFFCSLSAHYNILIDYITSVIIDIEQA